MKLPFPALALLALGACSKPPQATDYTPPGPLAGVHAAPADVWSGGEVSVVSSSFKALANLPVVQIAGANATVRRVDDSTIAAQLPDGNGVMSLHVAADSFLAFDGSITLHGFEQLRSGPVMSGAIQVLPGQPVVIGAGATGLVEVNVRSGAIQRQFPDSVHSAACSESVGQSAVPGRFVFTGKNPSATGPACLEPSSWQYGDSPSRVDFLWQFRPQNLITVVAELDGGGYAAGDNQILSLQHCTGTCGTGDGGGVHSCFNACGSIFDIVIGAIAHRAVVLSSGGFVVNTATSDTIYRLWSDPNTELVGATFSPAQDTVYAVGSDSLIVANSATGAIYQKVAFAGLQLLSVGRDPSRPWIYVAAETSARVPQLLVLDSHTLATLATLRAPASTTVDFANFRSVRVLPDPTGSQLFVLATPEARQFEPKIDDQPLKILAFSIAPQ